MTPEQLMAFVDRWTGGYLQVMRRLTGINPRSAQRWKTGELVIHPLMELVASMMDVLAAELGEEAAKRILYTSAERLGRKLFTAAKPERYTPKNEV